MTSTLEKILLGVLTPLIAVGTGEWLREERAHSEVLAQTIAKTDGALKAEKATSDSLRSSLYAALAALMAQQAKTQGELNAALKSNATWANQRMPDAVFNSVFGTASSANPGRWWKRFCRPIAWSPTASTRRSRPDEQMRHWPASSAPNGTRWIFETLTRQRSGAGRKLNEG